jgi:hypothetical protein
MKRLVVLAFLAAFLFSSCNYFSGKRIKGSGNVISQTRTVSGFTGIDVSSAIDVYVTQDSSYSVKVETDDNLQEYIIIREENGRLYIKQENNTSLNSSGKIKVYVSAPKLDRFYASGACNIIGQNKITVDDKVDIHLSGACDARLEIKAPSVSADLSGSTSLALKGETKDFHVSGSGSTEVSCIDLLTENTSIDISGAGNAEVYASVKLDIELSGAASVKYKGNASVEQNTSGAASVKKID